MKLSYLAPFLWGELRRKARENAKQGVPLDILVDFGFKSLFTANNEDSREALRHLLSACIGRPVTVLSIQNNELLPEFLTGKTVRLDIHIRFNNGELADLEMQVQRTDDNIKVRSVFLAARMLSGQAKRGKSYKQIRRVYQIFFLDFILFSESDKVPRRYFMQEEEEHDQLSDVVSSIFYELPKLKKVARECLSGKRDVSVLSADQKWGIFFKYRNVKKMAALIGELCQKEEGIMKADRALKKISHDEEHWARSLFREKMAMDYRSGISNAYDKGLEDGAEKARLALEEKDRILGEKDRAIAELNRKLLEAGKDTY
ncbi:Rpn family recombination-promoting nuclease/putative transposase [Treponema primitia]|uniref:Rpn family recombination-promoting nuclease/putative transposase n=1 Tax=Treponema primitia TaxID=88058 RepID=UPI0002554FF5|nr:Rpn family recombination-promoting nuclease/putative transposase [Treponema primitia]